MNVPEEWKDIEGYKNLYQVSSYGRIKSFYGWGGHKIAKKEKILAPWNQQMNEHYSRSVVALVKNGKRKMFKVHRIVAEAFLKRKKGKNIINHKDGNPLNNNVFNLEWCDQKFNAAHAVENDFKVNRINTIDRETMVDLLNSNYNYQEIRQILGVSAGTVCNYIKKFKIKKIYI